MRYLFLAVFSHAFLFLPTTQAQGPIEATLEKLILNHDNSTIAVYSLPTTHTEFTFTLDAKHGEAALLDSLAFTSRNLPDQTATQFIKIANQPFVWKVNLHSSLSVPYEVRIKLPKITHQATYLVSVEHVPDSTAPAGNPQTIPQTYVNLKTTISNETDTPLPLAGKSIEYTIDSVGALPSQVLTSNLMSDVLALGSVNVTLGSTKGLGFQTNTEADPLKRRFTGYWINESTLTPKTGSSSVREGQAQYGIILKDNWPKQLTIPRDIEFQVEENLQMLKLEPSVLSANFQTEIGKEFYALNKKNNLPLPKVAVELTQVRIASTPNAPFPANLYEFTYKSDYKFHLVVPAAPGMLDQYTWLLTNGKAYQLNEKVTNVPSTLPLYVHPVGTSSTANATKVLANIKQVVAEFRALNVTVPHPLLIANDRLSELETQLVLADQKISDRRLLIHKNSSGTLQSQASRWRTEINELTEKSRTALDAYNAMIYSYGVNTNETETLKKLNAVLP